jgi:hypothetical protein
MAFIMIKKMIGKYTCFDIDEIGSYDKVIVYGAGTFGKRLLMNLDKLGVNKDLIDVWDINAHRTEAIYGFEVMQPDFASLVPNSKTAIVIALSIERHAQQISEIYDGFIAVGMTNVFILRSPATTDECYLASVFTDDVYPESEYQDDLDFSALSPKVKALAYYLPQFHEIPENDKWWGKNFTEWTNVKSNTPRYKGHYQPREPHDDFGYYDLSNPETIRKQAALARRHGIYGWCIYYYWFSGKKLLESPIDLLVEHKEIDINFCLMWCNETWTKRWSGEASEVLIRTDYLEKDPERFIDDIKKYTDDERYICVQGKPVILIFNPHTVPDLCELVHRWQTHAKHIGIGELYIIIETSGYENYQDESVKLFDANLKMRVFATRNNLFQLIDDEGSILSTRMAYYKEWVNCVVSQDETCDHQTYLTCAAGFDNTPRYPVDFSIYNVGFTLNDFYRLSSYIVDDAVKNEKDLVFVFAWNEWAESAYLEPDKKYGYAIINTLSKAIYGLPFEYRG